LTITPASNIALLATTSASSETPNYSQTADKAIDNVIDGSPNDYTREWASRAETNGAWIQLNWPSLHYVDKIKLYDRPNSDDQILAATLSFSDGSSLAIGAFDNSGSPLEVSFAAKQIQWVRLTITSTSQTTLNIGLAEFQAFEASGPTP
jgi:hypothetical protein